MTKNDRLVVHLEMWRKKNGDYKIRFAGGEGRMVAEVLEDPNPEMLGIVTGSLVREHVAKYTQSRDVYASGGEGAL